MIDEPAEVLLALDEGPSVVSTSPSRHRTTVAVLGGVQAAGEDPRPGGPHLLVQRVELARMISAIDLGGGVGPSGW